MLVLTEKASQVIRTLVDDPEAPDESGLRIACPEGREAGAQALSVAVVDHPEEGDQIIEDEGARVLLEEEAAEVLDDKVLDAKIDDEGTVQFIVTDQ